MEPSLQIALAMGLPGDEAVQSSRSRTSTSMSFSILPDLSIVRELVKAAESSDMDRLYPRHRAKPWSTWTTPDSKVRSVARAALLFGNAS